MKEFSKAIEMRVSPADWKLMAKHAGMKPDELKAKMLKAAEKLKPEDAISAVPKPHQVILGKPSEPVAFDFTLYSIIGVCGTIKLSGDSGEEWGVDLQINFKLLGMIVWGTNLKFDRQNTSVCLEPQLVIAKAKVCYQIEFNESSICLRTHGTAYAWNLWGWMSRDFDFTILCLPRKL